MSESAPDAGESFTLNATVRNQGSGRSVLTTLRYYQSADSTITSGDTEIGTDSVSSLNARGSEAESIKPDRTFDGRHLLLRHLRECGVRGDRHNE